MTIQRFSSRTHRLDQSFLAEQLQGARRYLRIAGYFTSSLFEIAHEWLEPIPEVRIVCNVDLAPEGKRGTDHVFLLPCFTLEQLKNFFPMPRRARILAGGYPVHVILRGIDRSAIFFEDDDRRFFLEALQLVAHDSSVAVHAYVLMTSHLHLLMTGVQTEGVATVMKRVSQRYVQQINRTYHRTSSYRANALGGLSRVV